MQRFDFVSWHEHANDIASGPIKEALADDAHRDATQVALRKSPVAQIVENRNQQGEVGPHVVLDQFTARVGRLQHLTEHQPHLPGRLAESEHSLEEVINEIMEPISRRAVMWPFRQRHLLHPQFVRMPDTLDVETPLITEVVIDGSDVHPGGEANISHGSGLIPALGKLLPGGRENPIPWVITRGAGG